MIACDYEAEFVLAVERSTTGDPHHLTCTYRPLTNDLQVGQTVLFADGTVAMEVVGLREPNRAEAQG